MQLNNGEILENKTDSTPEFNPREFITKYIKYLPWILFSVLVCLTLAYTKLRYSTTVYEVVGKLIIKKQSNGYSNDKFESLFLSEGEDNIKDEIELIKSSSITGRVIDKFDLQKQYYNKGKIRSTLLHRDDVPFRLEINHLVDSNHVYEFEIKLLDHNTFKLNEEAQIYKFGQPFSSDSSIFKIVDNGVPFEGFATNIFEVSWHPRHFFSAKLISDLDIKVITEYSNVLSLKYETENIKIGKEIIDGMMIAYQDENLEDKRQVAVNALSFIDQQLDTLKRELGQVERSLQQYREKNKLIDVQQQSNFYLENIGAIQTQVTELEVKKRIVQSLITYLVQNQNKFKTVPTSLGIPEPGLIQLITEYNHAQLQHEVTIKGTTKINPVIESLETAIEKLRMDILQSLENIKESYSVALIDLKVKSGETSKEISTIPGKQKQLIEITRQQKILEGLYSLLLQKKLETSISSASTIYNSRIVESADSSNLPVKPDRKLFYIIALLIGLAIPIILIGIREFFNDKVLAKSDIEKATNVPILGEIGHAEITSALIVNSNNRTYIAEQFRILRSNLNFFIPRNEKPIILVTSSFSGEGKSFISTNLGAVLALSGKKTLILEFDIRKPKIMKGLGLNESKGITNYIVGEENIGELVKAVPSVENLFVMSCGPIPPNPSELLLEEKVGRIFEYAKSTFDIIIIDTAPVGMISDAVTLGQHANMSIYIVRHNYTLKKQIKYIEELYKQQKLPKLSIVINDVGKNGRYSQGYYGYGYGYGYGHSYESEYFEGTSTRKKRWNR